MKKISVFVFILFFYSKPSNAQKNEVFATFGLESLQQLGIDLNADHDQAERWHTIGSYFFTYRYNIGYRISIGATLGYQLGKDEFYDQNQHASLISCNVNTTTFCFEFKWIYDHIKYGEVYCFLGLGSTYTELNNYVINNNYPGDYKDISFSKGYSLNLQITPIGFRIGHKFSWVIEFGIGYKGLLNTGVCYKF